MFSTLRTRFGIPGVISVMALVFAMFGGAYAASNSSGGGKATASAKGKQGPRGKTGKTGPAGPAGPAGPTGPAGPAGAKGDAGAPGTNGTNGTNGTDGTSVVASSVVEGGLNCEGRGGSKFVTGATTTFACNGKEGSGGGGGGFPEVLAPGKTETGVWRFISNGEEEQFVPISFPIPLSSADAEDITYKALTTADSPTANCPGSPEEPLAEPGFLCVYQAGFSSTDPRIPVAAYKPVLSGEKEGVSTAGTLLYFASADASRRSSGSFAITAPEPAP